MKKMVCLLVLCGLAGGLRAQRFAGVDAWLEANTGKMGGRAVLMVEKDGKIVYERAVNDRRLGAEWTTGTRERIASCSKWLSAALVMTFVDEGRLNLDDSVGRWLPVLSAHGKGNITVRQCLSHLTGIREPPLRESLLEMRRVRSMDEAIDEIAEMPMEGEPGKVFHYSSAGLQIAGAILEKIGGQSFGDLFAARIAGPLGMTNTDFGKGPVALPAGGAFSTSVDYMHFLEMILGKGMYRGVRVLSERSVAEMQENRLGSDVRIAYTPAAGGNVGYGYGEWVMGEAVSSPGLFGSFPWVNNQRGYCAFLLCFYLNNKGKQERYAELMPLVNEAVQ
jgi:CubicO group peptidase (beta-lactamase class C family)